MEAAKTKVKNARALLLENEAKDIQEALNEHTRHTKYNKAYVHILRTRLQEIETCLLAINGKGAYNRNGHSERRSSFSARRPIQL